MEFSSFKNVLKLILYSIINYINLILRLINHKMTLNITQEKELYLELPSQESEHEDWLWTHNQVKKDKTDPNYVGKFCLFYNGRNEFEFNFKDYLPWKCVCSFQNSSNYEICELCFSDRKEKEDKKYKTCSLDLQWLRTIKHTENGNLGPTSKVSTLDFFERSGVIICYSKDYRDQEDVLRLARNICKYLGWKRKMSYKTDLATLSGDYATHSKKVSLYTYDPKTDKLTFSKK